MESVATYFPMKNKTITITERQHKMLLELLDTETDRQYEETLRHHKPYAQELVNDLLDETMELFKVVRDQSGDTVDPLVEYNKLECEALKYTGQIENLEQDLRDLMKELSKVQTPDWDKLNEWFYSQGWAMKYCDASKIWVVDLAIGSYGHPNPAEALVRAKAEYEKRVGYDTRVGDARMDRE